ncbi:MAG: hypothetical protein AMXMBFR59_02700 [Rhodanobacteraceae bacterium]
MIELNFNGKTAAFDAPAEMPLLWVLRDIAHLTGTTCGACTVHLDELAAGRDPLDCRLALIDRVPVDNPRQS